LTAAAALLAGWGAWFCGVPVTLVEVTDTARLEVGREAHPVAAAIGGQVVESRLELGREVQEGDVLVALDARALELSLAERRAAVAAIDGKLGPIAAEIAELRRALDEAAVLSRTRAAEGRARTHEAEAMLRFTEREAERQRQLAAAGLSRAIDVDRAVADEDVKRAELEAAHVGEGRIAAEERGHASELRGRLARLERDQAELAGAGVTEATAAAALEHAVGRALIRAPVAGRLGDVTALSRGAVLKEGEKVAAIVPSGDLRIVAELPPAAAFGRVRPGQAARLHLHGFPWEQYGEVQARVLHVASEPHEGKARVELSVLPGGAPAIPLQHGLPGSVEIEVERARPVELLLRTAGQALGAGRGGG
jgi:membrane fusion protein (multidrug efflux system)